MRRGPTAMPTQLLHLHGLRPAYGRHISHSLRPLAVDGGDDDVQCRQLRDHSGRQRHQHRRAGLSPDPNACRADSHAAIDHGNGRCQESGLWRCQSSADLSNRRFRAGQWRYVVRCVGNVSDNSQQRRPLRHHARYARRLEQLHTVFIYRRKSHRHPARDHGDGRRQEPYLRRCQSGTDLSGRRLRAGQRRYVVGCAGNVSDDSQQCRPLRHHARHARRLEQLHTVFIYRRKSHRHPAGDHGDGRCQEPRLWRCQIRR